MTIRSGRLLPLFTLLAACNFGNEPGKRGELGNDRFFYECVVDADAMCDGADLETEPLYGMPRIALGSTFGMDTEGVTTEPRAVNDRVTEEQSLDGVRSFTAKVEGWTSIMSRTYDEEAVDIIHVLVMPVAKVELSERASSGDDFKLADTTMTIDDDRELRVAPYDGEGNPLAGGLPIEWSSDPEGVVEITPKSGNNIVTVKPIKNGLVTLSAKVGADQTVDISLTVEGNGGGGGGGGDGGGGGSTEGGGGQGGGQ